MSNQIKFMVDPSWIWVMDQTSEKKMDPVTDASKWTVPQTTNLKGNYNIMLFLQFAIRKFADNSGENILALQHILVFCKTVTTCNLLWAGPLLAGCIFHLPPRTMDHVSL